MEWNSYDEVKAVAICHGFYNYTYNYTMKAPNLAYGNREEFRASLHEIPRMPCVKMGCICPFCVDPYRNSSGFRVWGFHFGGSRIGTKERSEFR